jgi:Domain of unknown function (DUF4141)
MKRLTRTFILSVTILALLSNAVSAQFVVYDPTNYAQAITRYAQLLTQYRFWVAQARRLPLDLASRYRLDPVRWRPHDSTAYAYARAILSALNTGDVGGTQYDTATDHLEPIDDLLPLVPSTLQRRLQTIYGSIQLGDSVAKRALDQVGTTRTNGTLALRTIQNMEDDAVSGSDDFNTQIAVLNKINGANVLGLRLNETSTELQLDILEQLIVQNKRTRDAEAQAMDAHVFQWRYGQAYGRDLFSRTAAALDSWRLP